MANRRTQHILPRRMTATDALFWYAESALPVFRPIIAGLFWKQANGTGAVWAMLLGSVIGLIAYFQIGWYTASLIGTAVSFLTVVLTTLLQPREFKWRTLAQAKEVVAA